MTPAPEQGLRLVVGTLLAVLATWASLLALRGLVDGTRWFVVACVAVLVVAVATSLARAATRRWWVPTAVGTVVALVGVVLRYGAPPGRPQFLPDLDAVGRAWDTARQGAVVINDAYVPMPDVRAAQMVLVVAALAVFLLVEAAALGLRVPAVAGLPMLAPWIPGIVLGFPAGAGPVFWGAAAYLVLLAYGAAPLHAQAGRVRRVATAAVATLALAAGSVVTGPALADLPGWASVGLPSFGDAPVGPLELSDDLDLRESLGARSSQVVLTYTVVDPTAAPGDEGPAEESTGTGTADGGTAAAARAGAEGDDTAIDDTLVDVTEGDSTRLEATTGEGPVDGDGAAGDAGPVGTDAPATGLGPTPAPSPSPAPPAVDARLVGPLRAFTMATFDGRSWERTDALALEPWDPATLLSSDPAVRGRPPSPEAGTLARVNVQVTGLRERRLPVSTFPRTLEVDGRWQYDAARDEVVGERATGEGMRYSMTVEVPTLTKADLADAEVGTPPDDTAYTALPDTPHRDDVAALAAEVTADAAGPYEQAVALQTWLRSAANFTYDTRVPPARTTDAVWDFLVDRRGYCVQFATAMAIMARTLDIPSRVGVGFLPGERAEDGSYVVTGRLAHAWPELYFEGHGWVRFEPTPAGQAGPPPTWADPFSGITALGSVPDDLGAQMPDVAPTAGATAPAAAPSGTTDEDSPWERPVLVVAVLVLLALGATAGVLVSRRRRRRVTGPEEAWAALRADLARDGVRWSDATTPRGAVREVVAAVERLGTGGLDDAAHDALVQLARAVEQSRYAPAPVAPDADTLDAWGAQARRGVREAASREPAQPVDA